MAVAKGETIQLSGVLDIRQAESVLKILKDSRSGKKSVVIDLNEAEDIDLAILQLIYSFKKSMKDDKRTVVFENINEKIMERISLCDFSDLLQES